MQFFQFSIISQKEISFYNLFIVPCNQCSVEVTVNVSFFFNHQLVVKVTLYLTKVKKFFNNYKKI